MKKGKMIKIKAKVGEVENAFLDINKIKTIKPIWYTILTRIIRSGVSRKMRIFPGHSIATRRSAPNL
jgi:hypothetical protein